MNCACVDYCGDVPEEDDDATAVCKGLPLPPQDGLLQLRIVHRNASDMPERCGCEGPHQCTGACYALNYQATETEDPS